MHQRPLENSAGLQGSLPRHAASAEPLESRRLLSGFVASIDFAPAGGGPVSSGSVADSARGIWRSRKRAGVWLERAAAGEGGCARIRAKLAGPDERYDTFAMMHPRGRGSQWQIQVPDGTYQVDITAGDPRRRLGPLPCAGRRRARPEAARRPVPSAAVSGSQQITVSNGLLTITVPRGSTAKVDFLDIQQIVASNPPPPTPTPAPAPNPTPTPVPTPNPTNGLDQPLAWQTLARRPIALAKQSVVANGKLYVFGGYNVTTPDYQPTNASEVFDTATNRWSTLAPMPAAETHMGVGQPMGNSSMWPAVTPSILEPPSRPSRQPTSSATTLRLIRGAQWFRFRPRGAGAGLP